MTEKDTNLPPKKRKVSENTGLDRTDPKSASDNVKSHLKQFNANEDDLFQWIPGPTIVVFPTMPKLVE